MSDIQLEWTMPYLVLIARADSADCGDWIALYPEWGYALYPVVPLEILFHKFLLSISISLYNVIYKHKSQQVETTHFPIVSSSKSTTPRVIKQIRS